MLAQQLIGSNITRNRLLGMLITDIRWENIRSGRGLVRGVVRNSCRVMLMLCFVGWFWLMSLTASLIRLCIKIVKLNVSLMMEELFLSCELHVVSDVVV